MGGGKDGVCAVACTRAKALQSALVTKLYIPYGTRERLSRPGRHAGPSCGRRARQGRSRARQRRSRSAPAQPRCPGRAAPEAAPGQGARKPRLLLWPSSSFAHLPYGPFPPRLLPAASSSRTHRSAPAASRSPCPGAPPRWCGMRWVGRSAAPLPGTSPREPVTLVAP